MSKETKKKEEIEEKVENKGDYEETILTKEGYEKLKEELTNDITDIKPIKVNLQDVTNLLKQLFNDANNKPAL